MSAISTTYLLLWLGLPLVVFILIVLISWRLLKKRPIAKPLVILGILVVTWFCLTPVSRWFWCREMMTALFGEGFSPKLIYRHEPRLEFNGDGTSLYLFEIPENRIAALTNADALNAAGLPRQNADMVGWQTVHWQRAPFQNDTNDIQFLAFSGGGDAASGVSEPQLRELMKQESTMFACAYKTPGGSGPEAYRAYIVSFYLLDSKTRRLVVIFSKI